MTSNYSTQCLAATASGSFSARDEAADDEPPASPPPPFQPASTDRLSGERTLLPRLGRRKPPFHAVRISRAPVISAFSLLALALVALSFVSVISADSDSSSAPHKVGGYKHAAHQGHQAAKGRGHYARRSLRTYSDDRSPYKGKKKVSGLFRRSYL